MIVEARRFYGGVLGCAEGRSSETWVDFNFYGHQLVAHLAPEETGHRSTSEVDGDAVPVRHFGVILSMSEWELLAERLIAAGVRFIVEPHLRFKDEVGEQATMFFLDPSGTPSSSRRSSISANSSRDDDLTLGGLGAEVATRRQLGSSELLSALVARLGLDWAGFRRVQGTVWKRLRRRVAELGLKDIEAYVAYLATAPDEWQRLDALCRIPISRFYRDGFVFGHLAQTVLRELAEQAYRANRKRLRVWSAGCASGEEPYSIAIAWRLVIQETYPDIELDVLGTDLDASMLERARRGCYARGTLRELPEPWRQAAFDAQGDVHCLRQAFRVGVRFECADLRSHVPEGPFDIVSCRNLAFTYFDEGSRARVANALIDVLRAGGVLLIGAREALPPDIGGLRERHRGIYEKRADDEPPAPA